MAQPSKLKAELQIAETQAKDIRVGQKAEIDTRNGIIPGTCDPYRSRGYQRNPHGGLSNWMARCQPARCPDLSVDGTVEIERLTDVVYCGPAGVRAAEQPGDPIQARSGRKEARRASQVKLGRTSVNTIEILDGLKVGDKVILSDMSAQDPAQPHSTELTFTEER